MIRNGAELITVVQNTAQLASDGPAGQLPPPRQRRPASWTCCPSSRRWPTRSTPSCATRDPAERDRADEAVPEALHREPLRRRAGGLSGRAGHQQALRQHPRGRADLHVQLGRGQHHARAGVRPDRPAAGLRAAPRHPARRAGRRRAGLGPPASAGGRAPPGPPRRSAPPADRWRERHAAVPRLPHPPGDPRPVRDERHHLRDHPGAAGRLRRLHQVQHDLARAAPRSPPPRPRPSSTARSNGLNDPMPLQYFRWIGGIVTRGDFGHSFFYNKPVGDVVAERLPRTHRCWRSICHILASVLGITFGILAATRQYSWVDTVLSFVAFLGMTVPRFLLALIILYILAFKLNVQELGQLLLLALRRAGLLAGLVRLQLGQALEPDPARLAGGRHRHHRGARLQHAGDAGEPARHAQRPVRRDRPRQGPARAHGHHAPRGAERAASARRLPGGRAALHADGRDRGGHRLLARHRRARPSWARWGSATSTSPRRCSSCSAPR